MDRRALGPLTAGCSSLLAAAEDILELLDGRVVGGRGPGSVLNSRDAKNGADCGALTEVRPLLQNSKMPKYLGA